MDTSIKRHGCSKRKIIKMIGLNPSSYYREPRVGKKGKRPSNLTYHKTKGWMNESELLQSIYGVLSNEFIDCGYRLMNSYLKKQGWCINHKKLYRIMKKHDLLKIDKRIRTKTGDRKFVKFRKVKTTRPFECLEMDIKVVWIPSKGKNAYLLSIIDVHTRRILKDFFSFSIKQKQVIDFLSPLFEEFDYPSNIVIRTDNGSQFIAKNVREYLSLIGVEQEFTHIATPEENAHIEAYHGILQKEVFQRFEYQNFDQIQNILKRFIFFYNNQRLHGRIGHITPMEKWNADKHLIIVNNIAV